MASNNRKAPPRWPPKNADDRNRHAASRAPQMGGSLHAKRRIDNKKIQETLEEMFYKVFDAEIIRSVAHSCGWKLNKSIETLMMLSEDSESPNSKLTNSFGTNTLASNSVSKGMALASKSSKLDKNTEKDMFNESSFTCTSSRSMQPSKGKSIMMNASQGPIKVMYKGQDDGDISDDADVVIEEENEFVMSGLDLSFADESIGSMYQFLTPFVSMGQATSDGMQYSSACESKANIPTFASKLSMKPRQSPSNLSTNICDKLSDKSPGKKAKHWPKLERIKRQICDGIKVMVLMRGCPGSGKTSLARKIIKSTYGQNEQKYIFSTDHYFIFVGNGKYKFDPRLLPIAHKWNQDRVGDEVQKETNPIIIDNTNLEAWEMEPYVAMAVKFGYSVEFLEPRTSWRNNSFELELKNTHGVSRKKIEDMLVRFEHDLTPAKLFALYNLKYSPNNLPPQYTSQQKCIPKAEDDSLKHGTKKKLKMKKKEDLQNMTENLTQLPKNEVAKQLQVSETLSSDFTDKEIKDSISMLLSEFNQSIEVASRKEEIDSSGNVLQESDAIVFEVSGSSNLINLDDSVCDNSENVSRAKREDITEEDINVFAGLGTEIIGDDEIDFISDSSENSEDANVPDDWEGDGDDNANLQCSSSTLSDRDKTLDSKNFKVEDITGMEYVLVMNDGTLLPQRSYHKESISCSLKGSGRVWEYLLMTDENSELMFHPIENNNSQNLNKSADVVPITSECDALVSVSSDLPDQNVADTKTTENTFLQKIAAEEPSLEYLLFANEDVENILCSNDVVENVGDDANSIPLMKSSYKGLDLLLAEGAASLNIAFSGIDDALSPRKSFVEKPSVGNECKENQHTIETEERGNNTLLINTEETIVVPIEITDFNGALLPQNKEVCNTNELASFSDVHLFDIKIKEVKHELIDMPSSSFVSGFESLGETCPGTNMKSDSNVTEDSAADLLPMTSFCEAKQGNECVLEGNVGQSYSPKDDKNRASEKDILEEWDEGNSWDEQESSVASNVNAQSDNSCPKPARNNRRQVSVQSSPHKNIEKVNKGEHFEAVADESWFAVEEPIATWEVENELLDKNKQKSCQVIEPQPQREMFALSLEEASGDKEDKITPEELMESTVENCREFADGQEVTLKPVAESDGRLNLTENVEFENQISATDNVTNDSEQQNLTIPNVNLCSSENEFLGATCSNFDTTIESQKPVIHSSTNTHHSDFIILGNVNLGSEEEVPGIKILPTFGRNIVDNSVTGSRQEVRKIEQVLMLDKSSMTYDIVSSVPDAENVKEQLRELVNMFPHCRIEDLQEIFEKCNRDINWTVDLLLESANQGIDWQVSDSPRRVEPPTDLLVEINSFTANEDIVENAHSSNTGGIDNANSAAESTTSAPVPFSPETSSKSPLPSKRNGKKDRTPVSEMSLLLKRQLEENIIINEEHYSEHVSRLRKIRHGEVTDLTEGSGSVQEPGECSDENIHPQSLLDVNSDELLHQHTNNQSLGASYVLQPEELEWGLHEIGAKDKVEEEEETAAIKMDLSFAEQLHSLFGTASLPFKQDMKPTLNLPLSLARQLHYYMMEAEQNTYDLMMQEDEEMARNLQVVEDQASAEAIGAFANRVPDLREIMDMEMALALYKTDQKQNNPESKEDLATKLTKNLLCEWFPSLPKDVLMNVFEAHNHSFEETLEVLLASTEEDNTVRTVMSPEARAAHERALLEKANLEGEKNKENVRPYSVDSDEVSQEQALQDANHYRSEASRHYDLRNECQRKAQSAYQRGFTAAASYYSQMASLHKERIEENNAKAASSLLLAHSLGNLSTTLDLHFLYVVEALQVLDMFLDHHIQQLLESSHRSVSVFVITGRGARSSGGRSRIKPAVVQRLDQRCLRHEEMNPGLLKVIITRNATTSSTRING